MLQASGERLKVETNMRHVWNFCDSAWRTGGRGDVLQPFYLLYVLHAWRQMKVKKSLSFEAFYQGELTGGRLQETLEALAEGHQLFRYYLETERTLNSFKMEQLTTVFAFLTNNPTLPKVFETLGHLSDRFHGGEWNLVSDGLAKLAIRLVGKDANRIYAPFTQSLNFQYFHPTKKYFLEDTHDSRLVVELMKNLDELNVCFSLANALKSPSFKKKEASHLLEEFDACLAFPPFMTMERHAEFVENDKFNRFKNFRGRGGLEIAYAEHLLAQTKGRAIILTPVGLTFRSGIEQGFRRDLVDRNLVEAVIQLPPNLLQRTNIESTLLLLNRRKSNDEVMFINLRGEEFQLRINRKNDLTNIEKVLQIFEGRESIDGITRMVRSAEIAANNFSFAVDRYVLDSDAQKIQSLLQEFPTVQLGKIALLRRAQVLPEVEDGEEVPEVSPSDLPDYGFVIPKGKRTRKIDTDSNRFQTYELKPFDVLLSTKGTIGKVGIVGDEDRFLASQAFQIIRPKKPEDAKYLYLFFKSDVGQALLNQFTVGSMMPQIPTSALRNLEIPWLDEKSRKEKCQAFEEEECLHKEIEKMQAKVERLYKEFLLPSKMKEKENH
ncbi:MAG: restriction endonuclease subunit M/S [Verrucomicrobiae bacterium]|nr:restriction endonuclease subunit M/S [Verrucomicrobiae bacterium]